ncbi:MAG: hypothetical protein WD844_15050 [Thermoleophilaceae bacterium]
MRGVALVACCAAMTLGLGAQAQAQTPLDGVVEGTLESVEKAPGEVGALLNGEQGPLATTSNILCPPVSAIDELLQEHLAETPVGAIGAGLTSLVCSAGLLEFEFHTRWAGPGGATLARTHSAIVGVPTPLNVDDDPAFDLRGTITLADGDNVAMVVERWPGEGDQLPVSVEAVLTDTELRIIGRRHLAFGYDAREDRAPDRFSLETPLDTLLGPQGEYRFDLTQQGRGETIALTGALFDGSIENRTNPSEVRLDYGASPDQASVIAQLGETIKTTLTTNRPGPAELSGRVVDETGEDSAALGFEDLPSQLTLELDGEAGQVRYGASAPVNRLTARVDTAEPTFLNARHFDAALLQVPQSFELTVGQGVTGLSLVTNEVIGQIDLRARSENRAFPAVPDGEAGAILDATGGELGLALRVFGLRKVVASFDPIALETDMEGGRVFTVDAKLEDEDGVTDADVVLDKMPAQLSLAIDSETGKVTYAASDPMDRLSAVVSRSQPIFLGAGIIDATLLEVPEAFELTLGQDASNLSLVAAEGESIGQIDIRARSANRPFPEVPAEQAGVILDATGGELGLALRVFDLRELSVALEPLLLTVKTAAGRQFVVDARLDQEDDDGNPLPPIHATGLIDELPADVTVGVEDLEAGGSRFKLNGSDPIAFLRLAVDGLELLPGADSAELELEGIPTELTVDLPEEGQLASLTASDHIGQLRLVASDGSGTLPADTLPGGANDLFSFSDVPGAFAIGVRLTAVRQLGVNLDPVNLTLQQDPGATRPIGIDAAFDSDGDTVEIDGLLNKPHASTSLSVELDPNQPTRLIFDNSANMQTFSLQATGLSGIDSVNATFTNLSKEMSICMDPGPACQRPNPHGVQRYGGPNATVASLDFDDMGSHGSGTGAAFRTTLNANIAFDSGDPIQITNLRFRNLGFDFEDANNPHDSNCGEVPRISLFFDSRGHPFVINSIRFPPTIENFRIGTDTNPARARNRIARLNGWRTDGFLGCLQGLDTSSAGGMTCGGAQVLEVDTLLGTINILDFLGFQLVPICGGSVSNPQPW